MGSTSVWRLLLDCEIFTNLRLKLYPVGGYLLVAEEDVELVLSVVQGLQLNHNNRVSLLSTSSSDAFKTRYINL